MGVGMQPMPTLTITRGGQYMCASGQKSGRLVPPTSVRNPPLLRCEYIRVAEVPTVTSMRKLMAHVGVYFPFLAEIRNRKHTS